MIKYNHTAYYVNSIVGSLVTLTAAVELLPQCFTKDIGIIRGLVGIQKDF